MTDVALLAPTPVDVVTSTWIDLARTVLVAHQRRGESDQAAPWIYVSMALDPLAPEWE